MDIAFKLPGLEEFHEGIPDVLDAHRRVQEIEGAATILRFIAKHGSIHRTWIKARNGNITG